MFRSRNVLGIHYKWGQRFLSLSDAFVKLPKLSLILKVVGIHVCKQYNGHETYSSQ